MPDNLRKEQSLKVTIRSRKKLLYKGASYSVTSYSDKGFFDVLPQHANMVSLIKDFVVVDKGMASQQDFSLERGVLTVYSDNVQIYVGI
jgi:F0F1-type ATP synthase epsilon subunit